MKSLHTGLTNYQKAKVSDSDCVTDPHACFLGASNGVSSAPPILCATKKLCLNIQGTCSGHNTVQNEESEHCRCNGHANGVRCNQIAPEIQRNVCRETDGYQRHRMGTISFDIFATDEPNLRFRQRNDPIGK